MGILSEIDGKEWHDSYSMDDKTKLGKVVPIVSTYLKVAVSEVPPSNQKLLDDNNVVMASKNINSINTLKKRVIGVASIIQTLESSESEIRNYIRSKAENIVQDISTNIQLLWSKIHPDEPIEDIKLYIPEDVDKSIDIGLRFHGLEQSSPRLTLSEGHRNSLGLCIFLALARTGNNKQHLIFLDDIVSSLDRGHRGNVTKLLAEDLIDHQVMLFTHDREWFQELKVLLPTNSWKFRVLKPWINPNVGLQWSVSEDTFDDARSLIEHSCESAGNCVRQIMDTSLAIAAENLRIKLPYARGDRNDRRTCIEFFESIMSEAKRRLKKEEAGSWQDYQDPIKDWEKAHNLIIAWANRASHTGSLVKDEVESLIGACELALSKFKCSECGTYIWLADQGSQEILQCRCGKTQWKYG